MLRTLLLYLSGADWARKFITRFPLARRVARRFVAGERLDDAIAAIRALNARGMTATLDHLGENVTNEAEARAGAEDYLRTLDRIEEAGITANVSLKLTQLGLDLGQEVCVANLRRILQHARAKGNFVRIDMEGSDYTERTLTVFRTLKEDYEFDNVGIVVQAYLRRSEGDIAALAEEGARVRLCKGAYKEPAEIAFQARAEVDASYVRLAGMLLDGAARRAGPAGHNSKQPPLPAIATHDPKMVAAARAHAAQINLPRDRFEFQMLYGIQRELQAQLVRDGFAVRIYVPYGSEWYPYFMRRLAERPANLVFFLTALFRG
ncbi:MAG: proline dehydrogenase family protein [Chloroflexi bacterium]|nr:proline dehydrogenase family protein [Chloroflexota bacterium]